MSRNLWLLFLLVIVSDAHAPPCSPPPPSPPPPSPPSPEELHAWQNELWFAITPTAMPGRERRGGGVIHIWGRGRGYIGGGGEKQGSQPTTHDCPITTRVGFPCDV